MRGLGRFHSPWEEVKLHEQQLNVTISMKEREIYGNHAKRACYTSVKSQLCEALQQRQMKLEQMRAAGQQAAACKA